MVAFFEFLSCLFLCFVDSLLKCSSLESGLIQKENFLGFFPPLFSSLGKNTYCKILFPFCSIKGNEAQKVSCNKGLRKNSLKSGYHLQRYLKKAGSSSVWHLVLFGKTKMGSRLQYCCLVENCKCLWHGPLSKSIRKEEIGCFCS